MENDFLDLKLKVRGKGIFDLFLAKETTNDFIELIKQSDEIIVQPAHSSLVEIAKKKHIKNNVILTKNELKQALGLPSKQELLKEIEIRRIVPLKLPPSPFHIETDCAVAKISIPPPPSQENQLSFILCF